MNTLAVVKGSHTHKTSSFVRACIANCFITIPSITSIFDRLQLYLLSAEVAVTNQAYPQGSFVTCTSHFPYPLLNDVYFERLINILLYSWRYFESLHTTASSSSSDNGLEYLHLLRLIILDRQITINHLFLRQNYTWLLLIEIDNRIRSTEPKVMDYLSQLLGFLQYVPVKIMYRSWINNIIIIINMQMFY